ncbi:MAG: phosphoribosyltransferase family protein [Candidatus Woesearchaeota archaeon]
MFKDRYEAGKLVAEKLKKYAGNKDAIILAIPRGALQNGYEMAKELKLPLNIVVTKKIPYPGQPEYAIGAVGPDGSYYLESQAKEVSKEYIETEVKEITEAIKKKYKIMGVKIPELKGKVAIIIDDGIATGSTMIAACRYVRKKNPKKIVVAVPVSAEDSATKVKKECNEFICLSIPKFFMAVGEFYYDFPQVEDEEAKRLLKEANK